MRWKARRQPSSRPWLFHLVAVLVVLAASTACAHRAVAPLWQQGQATVGTQPARGVLRSTAVTVDVPLLLSDRNTRFSLLLPDGRTVRATKTREERVGRAFVWHGTLEGEPSSLVSLSAVNQTVVGSLQTAGGRSFRLRREPGGTQVIEEIDPRRLPPEGRPTPAPGQRAGKAGDPSGDTCSTDGPGEIDVMVVYTLEALAGAGGHDAMEADIALAVSQANYAYGQSDVAQHLRLVHVAEVVYPESGDAQTDKDRLKAKADGLADGVHALRDTFGADIVVMVVEDGGEWCGFTFRMDSVGNAFEDSAFAVVDRECLTSAGKYSFTHELGHIMGAAHDWPTEIGDNTLPASPTFAYNHGHLQLAPTDAAEAPWRTVMSYNKPCEQAGLSCKRIINFSNPSIDHAGDPTGVSGGPQPEDNHAVLNSTALTVANFRCAKKGPANVWMRDTWSDLGGEPDPNQASLSVSHSPYIWVRNAPDPDLSWQHLHQNPEKGAVNLVYVKLHNGAAAPLGGTLKIYGAVTSTGLAWPGDWAELGAKALPSVEGSSTRVEEFSWTPAQEGDYCLLARWESPADPMSSPEGPSIAANVRASNNIIWRNVHIVDLIMASSSGDRAFIVRNTDGDRPMRASLAIAPAPGQGPAGGGATFLGFGEVTLRLDQALMEAWRKGGYAGSGFRRAGDTLVVTDRRGALLEGLVLDPRQEGGAVIAFARPRTGRYPRDAFLIDVVQSARDGDAVRVVGTITYQIHTDRLDRFPPWIR
jgi:hypothetical protein